MEDHLVCELFDLPWIFSGHSIKYNGDVF